MCATTLRASRPNTSVPVDPTLGSGGGVSSLRSSALMSARSGPRVSGVSSVVVSLLSELASRWQQRHALSKGSSSSNRHSCDC
eukprot:1154860-Alexandrium_andersonii.AAC.1